MVLGISPINCFTTSLALIAVKCKPAVAADKHMVIIFFGNNMDGATNEAD
jgi:hypothetical protein